MANLAQALIRERKFIPNTPLSVSRLHGSRLQPRADWFVLLDREKSIKKFDHRFLDFR